MLKFVIHLFTLKIKPELPTSGEEPAEHSKSPRAEMTVHQQPAAAHEFCYLHLNRRKKMHLWAFGGLEPGYR